MKLRTKMRVGTVTRWHMVRTHRQQTIGEHMCRVWNLVDAFCDLIVNQLPGRAGEVRQLAKDLAITHDLQEVMTGDIAAPTKRRIDEFLKQSLGGVTLADALDEARSERPWTESEQMAFHIVKICDKVESWLFIKDEGHGELAKGIAARDLIAVKNRVDSAGLNFPSIDWGGMTQQIMNELNQRDDELFPEI